MKGRQSLEQGGGWKRGAPDVVYYALKGVRLVGDKRRVAKEGGVRVPQQQTMPQLDCKVLQKLRERGRAAPAPVSKMLSWSLATSGWRESTLASLSKAYLQESRDLMPVIVL